MIILGTLSLSVLHFPLPQSVDLEWKTLHTMKDISPYNSIAENLLKRSSANRKNIPKWSWSQFMSCDSCPSWQWNRTGYNWSPVWTLLVAPLCCRTWIFCWVTVQVHRDRLLGVDPLVWRFCRRSSPVKPAPLFRERATPSQLPLPPSAASAITVSVSARCAQVNAVIVKVVCWERHERVESTWIASFRNFDKKLLWLCLRVLFLRFHWFPGDVWGDFALTCDSAVWGRKLTLVALMGVGSKRFKQRVGRKSAWTAISNKRYTAKKERAL